MLQAMFADVRAFTKGAPQSDDITALILRYGPGA
jgi:serine phosphatase RsbU (regulator of sigma subunit)